MGLPYQTEDYDGGGGGGASTINDLVGMNFSTLNNNELLKRVDANNVGGSNLYTFASSAGNVDSNIIYSVVNNNSLGSIVLEEDNSTNEYLVELRPNPGTANSLIIREDGASAKVGINVFNPEEALDIEGNLELRGASGKIFFKHPSGLQKVELDGDQDGTNGGKFIIKTKEVDGNMTEKLTINNAGNTTINGVLSATGLKTDNPVHIGTNSGATNQGTDSVAIGTNAADTDQSQFAIAIGLESGKNYQKSFSIAIGKEAGKENQFTNSISIGTNAGQNTQLENSIAIGKEAGLGNQGSNCIAIGQNAGDINQHNNTIILNAQTSTSLNTTATNGFYVAPIANASTANYLYYNTTSKQITYAPPLSTNYSQHVTAWGDIKVGNFSTSFTNNNTLDQFLPLYNQNNDQQLFETITLRDPTRPIRIDINVGLLYNETTVGFRIICDDGTTSEIVFGSQSWRKSTGGNDQDTSPYTCSVVHLHNGGNGGANLTVTLESYVRSNSPSANPFFFINPIIMPSGTIGTGTLLLTEL